jgi:hypothetical protein
MAITWNTDAEAMRLEKVQDLKEQLKRMKPHCNRPECVGVDGDCPIYGETKNCPTAIILEELDEAENYPDTYKTWQASRVLANREKDIADYDCILAEAQAALELERDGQVSTKTADLVRNARSLAQAKNDEFQAAANRKNQLETVRGK